MAAIRQAVEIGRSPEDVFAYLEKLDRHGEWQEQLVSVRVDTEGSTRVGSRATETRQTGRRRMTMTYEITEFDPPRTFAFRGIDGPLRPVGRGTLEPIGDGSRCRLTLDFDLEGRGFGKLLRSMAIGQARKQIASDHERLRAIMESGTV